MCRTLVLELGHEQLKTTKELLNITTRHASGKEAVGPHPLKTPIRALEEVLRAATRGRSADRVTGVQWPTTTSVEKKPITPVWGM
jgi:hypothetical protein